MQPVSDTVSSSLWSIGGSVSSWWSKGWSSAEEGPPEISGAFTVTVRTLLGDYVRFRIDNQALQEASGSLLLAAKRQLRPNFAGANLQLSSTEGAASAAGGQDQPEVDETCALITLIGVVPDTMGAPPPLSMPSASVSAPVTPMAQRFRPASVARKDVIIETALADGGTPRTPVIRESSGAGIVNLRAGLGSGTREGGSGAAPSGAAIGVEDGVDFQVQRLLLNAASARQLAHLGALVFEGHALDDLPADIGRFHELTALLLGDNVLTRLPAEISELAENLQTLELHRNRFASWPAPLKSLVNIESLWFSDNLLKDIPADIGALVNLKDLHLHRNRLASVNGALAQCTKLRVLELQNNNLVAKSLPEDIFVNSKELQMILIHDNQLPTLPASIVRCELLSELDVSNNALTALPQELGSLRHLVTLKASHNKLSSLPASIGCCQSLARLDLAHNELSSIPAELGSGTGPALQYLNLSFNQLVELPLSTRELTGILELRLSNNKFEHFPVPEISCLVHLKYLDASVNPFEDVPEALGDCSELGDLLLAHTQIKSLPSRLHELSELRILDASNTALESFPEIKASMLNMSSLRLHVSPDPSKEKEHPTALTELPASVAQHLSGLREFTVSDVSIRISRHRKQLDLPLGDDTEVGTFANIVASCPHPLLLYGLAELAAEAVHLPKFSECASVLSPRLLDVLHRKHSGDSSLVHDAEMCQEVARALASLSSLTSFQEQLSRDGGFGLMWHEFETTPVDELATRMSLLTAMGNLGFHSKVRLDIVKQHSLEPFCRLASEPDQISGIARKTRRLLAIFGVHNGNEHLMCDLPKQFCWCGSETFGHHHDDSVDHVESGAHDDATSTGGSHAHSQRGVRILALDGGGMRGVVTIEVLRAIETATGQRIPDMFDLIIGSSTGGILASMIGLRGYTMRECESLYGNLGRHCFVAPGQATEGLEEITADAVAQGAENTDHEHDAVPFEDDEAHTATVKSTLAESETPSSWTSPWSKVVAGYSLLRTGAITAAYDAEPLRRVVESQIGQFRMIDSAENDGCPLVAVPSTLVSVYPPELYLFRNYEYPIKKVRSDTPGEEFAVTELKSRYGGTSRVKLPNAIRATSAAPSFFDEYVHAETGQRFVDAGLIANNPAGIGYHEARVLWPRRPIDLVLSVGTGLISETAGTDGVQGVVAAALFSLTNPAPPHELLNDVLNQPEAAREPGEHVHPDDKYFRFDPCCYRDDGDVFTMPLDTTQDARLELLKVETRRYLRRPEVAARIEALARIVKRSTPNSHSHKH
jgi:Leucine-rich repeat (LRR) protein